MNAIASPKLKQQAQSFLRQIGLYERLKASRIYDLYWSYADPHWVQDRAKEVQFYRAVLNGLRKGDIVFDIGANDGYKTDVFLRLGAKVVAVEPDETNLEVLEGKFLKNRIFRRPVTIEARAVSDRIGKVSMFIDVPGSALNTLSSKWADALRKDETRLGLHFDAALEKVVETTTLQELISRHGVPFYVKIDVEGHELNVLRGLKQAVPYLSFEVNLPEFREEGLECVRRLGELAPEGEWNYASDCQAGLNFSLWKCEAEFLRAYAQCKEPMIEIFWRQPGLFSKQSQG